MNRFTASLSAALLGLAAFVAPASADIVSSVLPGSRAVSVGGTVTVFATILNADPSNPATGCFISPNTPMGFSYQTTDPSTNTPTGSPNTPANLGPGQPQSFVLALTPNGPISGDSPTTFTFDCANTNPAANFPGVNTLSLVACNGATSDVITVSSTPTNDGIAHIPGPFGTAAFSVAAVNIGAATSTGGCIGVPGFGTFVGTLFGVAVTAPGVHVEPTVCRTNPGTGQCLEEPSGSLLFNPPGPGTPMTFSVFVKGDGTSVPFDPAKNRVVVTFTEYGQYSLPPFPTGTFPAGQRGATSVAVTTN
jgi:hypothetical protein